MITGIYELTFADGSFYIGQSVNVDARLKQHVDDMLDGKHTAKIQNAYNTNGLPKVSLLIECHKDHLDYLEGYYILSLKPNLNTTIPKNIPIEHIESLLGTGYFTLSSLDLMDRLIEEDHNTEIIRGLLEEKAETEKEIMDRVFPGMNQKLEDATEMIRILHISIDQLNAELKLARQDPWYKRLFQ